MGSTSKTLALILIGLMAISSASLLAVRPANGQTQPIPTPSVPEFSVKYVDNSYYAPTSTTITDQNGNFRVVQGYVENKTFEFTIQNQAFTPYTVLYNTSQTVVSLMYNIRMKPHSSNDSWVYMTHLSDGYLSQSVGNSTIASYPVDQLFPSGIPYNSLVDAQVQALIGNVHRYNIVASWTFNGTESDWSSTQTVTIPASSPSPTSTSSVPEFPAIALLPLLLSVLSVAVIIRNRKQV
jgi:hypothetical protein